MGNSSTKEARAEQAGSHGHPSHHHDNEHSASGRHGEQSERQRNRQARFRNAEINLLGLGSGGSSNNREDAPYERRETRQEREARRLERERIAREKERERSMREEHVDGGYLVTLGTYIGPEDFSKPVVRQLQLERKIAPFWRGLNDKNDNWTEYQLVCAGRGLPIPAADEQPPEELIPKPQSPDASSQNLNNLTVPMGPRTLSTGSNGSGSTANASSALTSPTSANQQRSNSPFKPRAKALAAALSVGSRNNSSTDMTPREINLPHDPFINGQPLEVALYKDASECPICFMYYPPYLNRTRCCDQPICSECFVQIKRADPHFPEHHTDEAENSPEETRDPETLISEPATCPYCQQTEFGVTYDSPNFRRGLAYAMPPLSSNTAMSSQSSINSTLPSSPTPGRRRNQSLSANAPNVITTDRVRPDWSTKLAAQRAHQARRAAAATALHTAAFLVGNENQSRGFGFTRPGRFSRRNTGQANAGGANDGGNDSPAGEQENGGSTGNAPEPGPRGSSGGRGGVTGRRNRMEELEDMMLMEAVRLSIAAEEERQRKQEKAERKEAKKREKEERKAAKKAEKHGNFYGGPSSASGSSLSLGLGRRRGNSAASHLRMETTAQAASSSKTDEGTAAATSPTAAQAGSGSTSPTETGDDKGKGKSVDRSEAASASAPDGSEPGSSAAGSSSASSSLPMPTSTSRGPSHLRQISNASSISSSMAGDNSAAGSYSNPGYLDSGNQRASQHSAGGRSEDADRDATEPMFNFRSLAEMVGVDLENGESTEGAGAERQGNTREKDDDDNAPLAEQVEDVGSETKKDEAQGDVQGSAATLRPADSGIGGDMDGKPESQSPSLDVPTPELTITPDTPAVEGGDAESKQLGSPNVVERSATITQ